MKNQFCILIHYHEISLKGKNRSWFEKSLIKNIKKQLTGLPLIKIHLSAARIFCSGIEVEKWEQYKDRLKKIICVKNATLMHQVECTIDAIQDSAADILRDVSFNTFRIAFPSVDLPEPDSPTIPIVSPCFTSKLTSFTA